MSAAVPLLHIYIPSWHGQGQLYSTAEHTVTALSVCPSTDARWPVM
jgi:hypothetical protein